MSRNIQDSGIGQFRIKASFQENVFCLHIEVNMWEEGGGGG